MIVLKDIDRYDKELREILNLTIRELQERSKYDKKLLKAYGSAFEIEVCETLNKLSTGYSFHNKFIRASAHYFPDLYAKVVENNWFGVEVKTSQDNWRCFGNSIFESLRIPNLDDRIYIFFGKFTTDTLECKWAKYEDCIDNINITHSPRYQINMDIKDTTSLSVFNKMSTTYFEFSESSVSKRMELVRKLKRQGIGQDIALWWLPDHEAPNKDDEAKLIIQLFSKLPISKKEEIKNTAIALFPEIFSKNGKKKYARLPTWLASQYGVVMGNIRDMFTAGGKWEIDFKGKRFEIPKISLHLYAGVTQIKNIIKNTSLDELSVKWQLDINEVPDNHNERVVFWINKVSFYLEQQETMPNDFPLKEWLLEIFKD